jgi:hypothetical protein
MDFNTFPLKRPRNSPFYDQIVPNGSSSGYIELLMKLQFTENLIKFTETFLESNPKIHKKPNFEINYNKTLIGLRMIEEGESHILNHQVQEDPFIETQKITAKYSHFKDFLQGNSTSQEIIRVYLEFLKTGPRKLLICWEEFLEMIENGCCFDIYTCVLIYLNEKDGLCFVDKCEKVVKWFARRYVQLEEKVLVMEKLMCQKFFQCFKIGDWTNEQLLVIIRKIWLQGQVDEDFQVPEGFASMILHDIYSVV